MAKEFLSQCPKEVCTFSCFSAKNTFFYFFSFFYCQLNTTDLYCMQTQVLIGFLDSYWLSYPHRDNSISSVVFRDREISPEISLDIFQPTIYSQSVESICNRSQCVPFDTLGLRLNCCPIKDLPKQTTG